MDKTSTTSDNRYTYISIMAAIILLSLIIIPFTTGWKQGLFPDADDLGSGLYDALQEIAEDSEYAWRNVVVIGTLFAAICDAFLFIASLCKHKLISSVFALGGSTTMVWFMCAFIDINGFDAVFDFENSGTTIGFWIPFILFIVCSVLAIKIPYEEDNESTDPQNELNRSDDMKLTKYMHNHYYDGSKYTKCPHCIEKGFIPANDVKSDEVNIKSDTQTPTSVSIHPPVASGRFQAYGRADSKTVDMIYGGNPSSAAFFSDINKAPDEPKVNSQDNSVEFFSDVRPRTDTTPHPQAEKSFFSDINKAPNEPKVNSQDNSEKLFSDVRPQADTTPHPQVEKESNEKVSLQDEISSARHIASQDSKTIAFYDIDSTEPVVGWLVALNGSYIGESFCLKAGRNNIGRWTKMDVALPQEASVSRDRHAILTFDPSGKKFFIQPGEGGALVYLNDNILLTPLEIHDGDVVRLGDCRLLFKSLCGEAFTWDTYLKGNN